jgi:hypothetical protein
MGGGEKTFRGELTRLRDLLRSRTPFALSRFGHAEMEILQGKTMRGGEVSGGHEFRFAPAEDSNIPSRRFVWDAFVYRAPNYLVGINCPHCITDADFDWLRRHSGQSEENLTFSTIYFYSNYVPWLAEVVPLFREYQTVLVCHENCDLDRLPFTPVQVFRNQYDAWRKDLGLIDDLKRCIEERAVRGGLFLFCCGALGTILAHRLYEFCPENTYLDIGSSLDPYLFTGMLARNRRYLKQDAETQARESCYWKPPATSG